MARWQSETRLQRARRYVMRAEALVARQQEIVTQLLRNRADEQVLDTAAKVLKAFRDNLAVTKRQLADELAAAKLDHSQFD